MGDSPRFENNNDGTDQSSGIVVIAQGLTNDPIEIPFPEMRTIDSLHANVVAESGAILHELSVESPIIDFTGLSLPDGQNKLVVWSGEDKKETMI